MIGQNLTEDETSAVREILDVAQRELRSLLGPNTEIERSATCLHTRGLHGPRISVAHHTRWDHAAGRTCGCVEVCCSVPKTHADRARCADGRQPIFALHADDLRRRAEAVRRSADVMALAAAWHKRWGGLRWPKSDGLPEGFPLHVEADGRRWCWTGKVGTDIKTGQPSAEYGTDAIRYWRRADGTVTAD